MKNLLLILALLPALCLGQLKISQLTENTTITGTEEIPLAKSGSNFKENFADLRTWIIGASFTSTPITVDVATTAALSGTWTYNNGTAGVGATYTRTTNGALATTDGVSSVAGQTYLIKNQTGTNRRYNGVYTLTTVGSAGAATVFTRLAAGDEASELDGQVVIPSLGTTNARRVFSQTTTSPTVGTSNLIYVIASASGGNIRSDGSVDFTATQAWDDGSGPITTVSPSLITMDDGDGHLDADAFQIAMVDDASGITAAMSPVNSGGFAVTLGTVHSEHTAPGFSSSDGLTNQLTATHTVIELIDESWSLEINGEQGIYRAEGTASELGEFSATFLTVYDGNTNTITVDAASAGMSLVDGTNTTLVRSTLISTRNYVASNKTINTTAGDSGTLNGAAGRFRKDTSGATYTINNSFIDANSIIILTPANAGIDATATGWTVNAGSGSATVTFNAAPTANFDMNFFVIN